MGINKRLSGLIIAFMLLLNAVPFVFADTTGNSNGTATVSNADPTIDAVYLTDTSDVSQDGQQIDVQTTYKAIVTVTDNNKLSQLDNITIIIWEDATANEGDADADATHYTFTYDEGTDTWDEVGPDGGGNTHLVGASCADPADHSATSGNFTLGFKLAKTATHTATDTWVPKFYVYDESNAVDSDGTLSFGVNFYAELTVNDPTHGWSSVAPGSSDNVMDQPDGDLDITITANAAFDIQAKSAAANLVSGGNTMACGQVKLHESVLGSAIALTTDYADIGGLTSEAAGASQAKSFILWIDVPAGQAPGDYTYTLNIQVIEA